MNKIIIDVSENKNFQSLRLPVFCCYSECVCVCLWLKKAVRPQGVYVLLTILATLWTAVPAVAGQVFIVQGVVSGVDGKPVRGADVLAYYGKNVKKPADFTSNRTGPDGAYKLALPAGHYWLAAIFRKDGRKFGPLGLADKHSEGAIELDVGADEDLDLDFTVMGLRDAAKKQQKANTSLVHVSGTIKDEDGEPVALAYAMADSTKQFKKLPKYISAWTDKSGHYSLYLPKGRFYFGAALGFPPDTAYLLSSELSLGGDVKSVDLVLQSK